jgi:5-methylcytosine-specific restriction protein A
VTTAGKYCEAHSPQNELQRQQFDRERQRHPIRQLYGTATWQATSRSILARDRLCCLCRTAFAEVCDHRTPARVYVSQHGGDLQVFFDENNLQGLCKRCHDAKTARETGWGR